jgi:hypothetical protein
MVCQIHNNYYLGDPVNNPNSNPLEHKPTDETTSAGTAIPKPTAKIPNVVSTPSAAPNGKPASPRLNEVLTSSRGPAASVSPGKTATTIRVPSFPPARPKQKAIAGAARQAEPQTAPNPPRGAATCAAPEKDHDPRIAKPPQPVGEPAPQPKTPVDQYFYPEDYRVEDVRPGIRQAYLEIVDPCMRELVIGENRPLRKAIAASVPFEVALIISLQCALLEKMQSRKPDPEEIDRLMSQLDRAERRKQRMLEQLLKMDGQDLRRRKHGPLGLAQ